MKNFVLVLIVSLAFLSFSHSQENNDSIGNEVEDIFRKHAFSRNELSSSRGMQPRQEFKKLSITDFLLNYKNNTSILVYTFIEDTLQILIINKEYKLYEDKSNSYNKYKNYHLIKTSYHQKEVVNDIKELNSYFSSQFSNILFSDRGSIPNNTKLKERDFQKLFDKVNKYLLPDELKLENIEHLIIVPTANIGTLPFSALKIGDNYLIDYMSYSIAPSLSSLTNETKSRKNGFDNALFISNPDFPKDDKWNFAKLPGTEKEVQGITSNLEIDSYKILNGINASKNKIESNMQNYELLYFATHGYSDPKNSLDDSFIALSGKTPKKAFLTPREIQHKTLKAKLVVLSACQTGLGVTHEGGIIGLSRSFQLAGADHVLMSLWSINDNETATLMTRFFNEYLNEGEFTSPHKALRKAILKYKAEINPNPKYWAAFSIFGAPYTDHGLDVNVKVSLNHINNSKIVNEIKNYIADAAIGEIVEEEILSDIVVIENINSNSYRAIPYKIFNQNRGKYLYGSDIDRDIELYNIEEIKKTIFTYAQGDYLKKIQIKNENYHFDFKLIPVELESENDSIIKIFPDDYLTNENGIIEVRPEIDYVVLQVTNKGALPLYFSIVEIDIMGQIFPFMPNDNCSLNNDERKLNPGQTMVFKDCIFSFGPPYGKYVLKGFSSEFPFDFYNSNNSYYKSNDSDFNYHKEFRIESNTEIDGMNIFTQEFEYIIIKE